MPLRVKSRSIPGSSAGHHDVLRSPSPFGPRPKTATLPAIELDDSFRDVIKKLSVYIAESVTLPCTFEQLRTTSAGDRLRALVTHLSLTCDNPCIVNALLALKWHYGAASDDRGLSEARANACEIVAWRFLTHLSEREAVDFCLYEIPSPKHVPAITAVADVENGHSLAIDPPVVPGTSRSDGSNSTHLDSADPDENSPLLARLWPSTATPTGSAHENARGTGSVRANKRYQLLHSISRLTMGMTTRERSGDSDDDDDPTAPFVQLNALEIAAVADAKRFLSQNVVQKIITGIWNGDIVFWGRLEVDAVKKPHFYNTHTSDPFSRLRVPKYLKSFEVLYFTCFLAIFYLTLLDRNPTHVSAIEFLFYVFLAAFAYDEMSEWIDAGSTFYVYDLWNLFDLIMVCIGVVFAVLRAIGLSRQDAHLIDFSFDVLSLEALFMVPRITSVLSLSPYWGTLIPCFKEMTKDFVKFMVLVVIIYLGFLTTFSLIGRDVFTLPHMTMILTKIFFGSSFVGFEIMDDIDPVFGPPLMLIFITLSSILLMGSLTGMLSNSFSRVMGHAKEEYLYVYSIYVLEASTSNRLTHFYPPFNLIALIIFRPLRLFLPSDRKFRAARIALLKATHLPIVAAIQVYELVRGKIQHVGEEYSAMQGPRQLTPAIDRRGHANSILSDTFVSPKKSIIRPSMMSRPASQYLEGSTTGISTPTEEDTGMDAPSDTEVRISELSAKIDRLTELILQLQTAQSSSS